MKLGKSKFYLMVDNNPKISGQILYIVDTKHFLLKFVEVVTKIVISGKIHFLVDKKKLLKSALLVVRKFC